ncbi:methyl-accepting chemotaxis protein [Parahaliea aestuarii]|nr:methyl-accepting chemotaxis protein [Parahaliea aestuarii]
MMVILAAGITVNSRITARASDALTRVQAVQFPAVEALRTVQEDFANVQEALSRTVTEGDTGGLTQADESAAEAREALARLGALDEVTAQLAAELSGRFEQYYSAATEATTILLGNADGDPGAAIEQMQQTLQAFDSLLQDSSEAALVQFSALLAGSSDDLQRTLQVFMLSSLVMLIVIWLGSWLQINRVLAALGGEPEAAVAVVRRIADGDFTTEVQTRPGDQSSLLYGIAVLKAKLGELMQGVHSSSDAVDSAAAEVSSAVGLLSERTSGQAANLQETAASMEEMTSTLRNSAEHSRHANDLAQAARTEAEGGLEVVNRAVDAMSEIDSSSKKIADIIGVIDEIAFQTNLLALNAAVEAARAGEQGRGFAVVASEVGSLAQRSSSAAGEIKALIQDSVGKIRDGRGLVNESGNYLNAIVASVKKVTDIIGEISTASQEQAAGLEQVNHAVTQMDRMTQQNAAMVEQVTELASRLTSESRDLAGTVSAFRIEAAASAEAQPVVDQMRRAPANRSAGNEPLGRAA